MTKLPTAMGQIWPTVVFRRAQPLRFDLHELSGSLGDLGTFLPLSVALALTCGMDLGLIFIFAGLMNIATGIAFRQPIPVQPMKAIAAVAIAEGLTAGSVAAAGMITGTVVFALALRGGADWVANAIPKAVVRGLQAGIGVKLMWTGMGWLAALPTVGFDSWAVAAIVGALSACCIGRRQPVLLYAFLAGFVLLALGHDDVYRNLTFDPPALRLVAPGATDWWIGLTRGAIPQLPLTILNSVIAVCALSGDYFPGRGIVPRRMAASVGLMNLLCVPLGAMPMCHGAGGLAAQHHYGARTGGSVVMLGTIKIAAGALLGGVLLNTLDHYPKSILAVMVIVSGLVLAGAARDCLRGRSLIIVAAMAVTSIAANTLTALLVGCLLAAASAWLSRRWGVTK
ncbi:MAG: putative sulfate/molybdate transporter [Phycisphaeraceae bacterium]|nr:putative sulfate/molybdate transporter [Phycisphaeraceae bacterium]